MKKIFAVLVCLILALLLAQIVFADDWKSGCKSSCPQYILDDIVSISGKTPTTCCYGCWEWSFHDEEWCGYKWEFAQTSPLTSPLGACKTETTQPTQSTPNNIWGYSLYDTFIFERN